MAATPEEIERNPRSHSARLRGARKLPRGTDTDDERNLA
jgi:16S rRNA C1402 N4-methylase RsmH